MNGKHSWPTGLDEPARYEIRIDGHIDAEWADWFEGLTVTIDTDGTTLLSGLLADQAALHGLLRKVGSLGMTLLSINVVSTLDPNRD
ncbi:hypothetical protein [Arthrobacter sp. CAN_C5]|uniref:hypothetical protein n=1 Tax=Arthrobacter sp. CAN_C5 TaxID=2760706 RepID=UPI001AEADEE9|nr:hypothetical protein [Arthrobacter sp. CAN_C5]MBP2217122.1 hypothetical protein [Arthrobacter sp. CAN_C5]